MVKRILYICDRKKCEVCHSECTHTLDPKHAANFEQQNIGNALLITEKKPAGGTDKISLDMAINDPKPWAFVYAAEPTRSISVEMTYEDLWMLFKNRKEWRYD